MTLVKKMIGITGLALASAMLLAACSSESLFKALSDKKAVTFATVGQRLHFLMKNLGN